MEGYLQQELKLCKPSQILTGKNRKEMGGKAGKKREGWGKKD